MRKVNLPSNTTPEAYLKARNAITTEDAIKDVRETVATFGPKDATVSDSFMFGGYVRVDRAWAVSADLTVRLKDVAEPEHFDTFIAHIYEWYVELSWSSTGRSVAEAHAAITLYQEMTNLAALIKAKDRYRIVRIHEKVTPSVTATKAEV